MTVRASMALFAPQRLLKLSWDNLYIYNYGEPHRNYEITEVTYCWSTGNCANAIVYDNDRPTKSGFCRPNFVSYPSSVCEKAALRYAEIVRHVKIFSRRSARVLMRELCGTIQIRERALREAFAEIHGAPPIRP